MKNSTVFFYSCTTTHLARLYCSYECHLGPFQTSNFSCVESNVNEQNPLFELIKIRFDTWKVRRLKYEPKSFWWWKFMHRYLSLFKVAIIILHWLWLLQTQNIRIGLCYFGSCHNLYIPSLILSLAFMYLNWWGSTMQQTRSYTMG